MGGGGGHAAAFPLGFVPFALHGRKQVGEKIILSTRRISTALRIQVNARIARLPPNPADGCRFYFFFFFFFLNGNCFLEKMLEHVMYRGHFGFNGADAYLVDVS